MSTPDQPAPALLITGASGFLGRHLVEALPAGAFRLHVTGRSDGWAGPGLWQRADLLDPVQRAALIRSVRPDILVHCAWESRPGYAPDAPENLDWLAASLDLLRLFAAEGGRRALLLGDATEYAPDTVYDHARRALTDTVQAASSVLGLEILTLRPFGLVGPGDRSMRLPMAALAALRQGRPFELHHADRTRDWLDIRDAATAIAALLDAPATGIVDLASGRSTTDRALVEAIAARLERLDLVTLVPTAAMPARAQPDVTRLRQLVPSLVPRPLQQTIADLLGADPPPQPQPAPAVAATGLPDTSGPEFQPIGRALAASQFGEAERLARELLQARPGSQLVRNMLALAIRQQGRIDEARTMLEDIVRRDPSLHPARLNLATLLQAQGAVAEALPHFEAAYALQPRQREVRAQLLRLLVAAGRLDQADEIIDTVLAEHELAQQERSALLADRGRIRLRQNRFHEALDFTDRSIAVVATSANLLLKALLLHRAGRAAEAVATLQLARERWPNDPTVQLAWAQYRITRGDHRGANETLRELRAQKPDDEAATMRLISSLQASRYGDEAALIDESTTLARDALQRFVFDRRSRSPNTLVGLQYAFQRVWDDESMRRLEQAIGGWRTLLDMSVEGNDAYSLAQQIPNLETMEDRRIFLSAHLAWGERLEARIAPVTPARRTRAPSDRLRVGLLSGDLRHHPVAFFAMPLIERHDRSRLELRAYTTNPGEMDPVQRRIGELIAMRSADDMSDDALAQLIADDRIDVLLDLSGLTMGGRPELLARKPAPVQASWVGYVHSMGMSRIDYLVTDPWLEPPDLTLVSEKPLRLPGSYYAIDWLGFPELPIEEEPPQLRTGRVTFGITNNPMKYSAQSIALWARTALSVPGSRILMLRPEGAAESFRTGIQAAFARHGIEPGRVDFIATRKEHLRQYDHIDVALDSMPRTGGTTTCESLWMGVPVVTLVGAAQYERLSNSVLRNADLGELCTGDADAYVETARRIATDPAWLREFRRTIRSRIRANPLGQPQRFADDFVDLLRSVA